MDQHYGCMLEFGGDDQWSNIIGGVELVRRKEGKEVYGVTFSLLTTSDGVKMGKTVKGAVWLDKEKTPPYELYQYLRNVADADVIKCLKLLTFVPIEEIREMEQWKDNKINEAKVRLAYEVTKIVHGQEEADKAKGVAESLFSGTGSSENMATTKDYIEYVCERLHGMGGLRYRKMFGEYMVYVNDKPVLLVCDNTVFVKIVPELAALMADAERGLPYEGAKEHYILDIDDTDLARQVVAVLETVTPLPKPKKKKAE